MGLKTAGSIFSFLLIFFALAGLFARQAPETGQKAAPMVSAAPTAFKTRGAGTAGIQQFPVTVEQIKIVVKGRTRPSAVKRNIKLKEGRSFSTASLLVSAIQKDVQDLVNRRIFASVEFNIEYLKTPPAADKTADQSAYQSVDTPETATPDSAESSVRSETCSEPSSELSSEPVPVVVTLYIVDTWTIFPFFIPSSTRGGTRFSLAVEDENFLGTMTTLKLSGGVNIGNDVLTGEFGVQQWNIYLSWLGMTVNQWTFSQKAVQSHVTFTKASDTAVLEHYSFDETGISLFVRYEIPKVRYLYTYFTPSVSWRYNYTIYRDDGKIDSPGFLGGAGLGVKYRKINWIGFYRKGWACGIFNMFQYALDTEIPFRDLVSADIAGYQILKGLNIYSRLSGMYISGVDLTGLGVFLRGVKNYQLYGNRAIFNNNSLQIKIHHWEKFEPHLVVFMDMGLAVEKGRAPEFFNDFHAGTGLELALFFPEIPGFQINLTGGADLMINGWTNPEKWQFGLSSDFLY